jgi:hypothetical protein
VPWGVYIPATLETVVAICALVGVAQSLAFGAACQCAARFTPRSVVVFTCGYQASPVLVLAATLATGGARLGGADLGSAGYWGAASLLALLGVGALALYLQTADAAAVLADASARLGALSEGEAQSGYVQLRSEEAEEVGSPERVGGGSEEEGEVERATSPLAGAVSEFDVEGVGVVEVRWKRWM